MNFTAIFGDLWVTLFGTTEFLGLNIGFWMAFGAIALLVVIQNAVFWGMKPRK